jgi:hypothetical protein
MGFYALSMAAIAAVLQRAGRPANDLVMKFLEHLALISQALRTQGLWSDEDGLFYDRLVSPDGSMRNVEVRSIVGILPLLAVAVIDDRVMEQARTVDKRGAGLLDRREDEVARLVAEGILPAGIGKGRLLLGVVSIEALMRIFANLFDEEAFLSPHGLRAVSRYHLDHPLEIEFDGMRARIDYEPAESTTAMFGGNSNWRGPIWFPINCLVVSALVRYARFFGDGFTIEYPTHSGTYLPLQEVADDLRNRLISLFTVGRDGRRPCFGWVERLQVDPAWKDNILFNEYFHGDNGAGLGASHQTGWTGMVADLIIRGRGAELPTLGELLEMALKDRTA